jgi:hypothetical protein
VFLFQTPSLNIAYSHHSLSHSHASPSTFFHPPFSLSDPNTFNKPKTYSFSQQIEPEFELYYEVVYHLLKFTMMGFNPSSSKMGNPKNLHETSQKKRVPTRVWLSFQISMAVLVGGNHTSSRFCTR